MAKRQPQRRRKAVPRTTKTAVRPRKRSAPRKHPDATTLALQRVERELRLALDALQRAAHKSDVEQRAQRHLSRWLGQIDSGFAEPGITFGRTTLGAPSIDGPRTGSLTGSTGGAGDAAPALSGHGSGPGG